MNTQFLEVPRFKAVVRCLVQKPVEDGCHDRVEDIPVV